MACAGNGLDDAAARAIGCQLTNLQHLNISRCAELKVVAMPCMLRVSGILRTPLPVGTVPAETASRQDHIWYPDRPSTIVTSTVTCCSRCRPSLSCLSCQNRDPLVSSPGPPDRHPGCVHRRASSASPASPSCTPCGCTSCRASTTTAWCRQSPCSPGGGCYHYCHHHRGFCSCQHHVVNTLFIRNCYWLPSVLSSSLPLVFLSTPFIYSWLSMFLQSLL